MHFKMHFSFLLMKIVSTLNVPLASPRFKVTAEPFPAVPRLLRAALAVFII